MKNLFRPLFVLFAVLTLLTGVLYPVVVTGLGRLAFPAQVEGSLLYRDGKVVGSKLIGQHFDAAHYFWGRPSATASVPYDAQSSSGSNWGPTHPALADGVKQRIAKLRAVDPRQTQPLPIDLVTASASGLDPEISVAAAQYQASRVAQVRHLPLAEVEQLIQRHTQARQFGLLGEARVNVLLLNLALDEKKTQ
ncbi:K+-transporting ATPase, C subunit [Mycoavidus cysteinexigens]|uniref:Potassium-transporting ATPase KdpC subunit n=1 Tax=Mycoavidus cysteinexigens TaxID=1553431 RepID=A0A2Z6EUC6_9BURK|nr:potassium-transporting ATPase subunit KdpC [Mycoavidus cysteinexigens]BBE09054.1 K+-transporting ATPase, C subunit [Mycoavidus cysteinexigens]GAM52212.1 potassium-transporting ATPase C chain [bacterium endosymbiont of Mortierella elongata FMR23-6]GLR00280.1 potassium-transporting ATPase KdpC subunit [Mycoavidus cysteinexigens]